MRVVWKLGEASTRQIQESLPGDRHYNSVMTIIRVLEKKAHLTHREDGRTHIYRATVSPENSTVRPAVAIVRRIAIDAASGSSSGRRASSSRNRLTTNSA